MTIQYGFPTPITVGPGSVHQIADLLKEEGFESTTIVTDSVVANLPWFVRLVEKLRSVVDVHIFSDFSGNPICQHVEAGVGFLRKVEAESVVAIGGGAALDVAKAMILMQHHPGHLFDYEDGKPDVPPVDGPIAHLIAVPTTAGTGSEVGRSAVISDDETHAKKIIFSPRLLPKHVFLDADLCLGLPASVTATTGWDAFTHLIEAFLAKGDHPMCDGIALEGLRLVKENLTSAVEFARANDRGQNLSHGQHEQHLDVREAMLNAAMMGAVAFQKGLGVNHSCAHALSTVKDVHHGLANALMLKACMHFNAATVPEKFDRIAQSMGLATPTKDGFFMWLNETLAETSIPPNLEAIGVDFSDLNDLIEVALADVCHPLGPRAVTRENFEALFREAMTQ